MKKIVIILCGLAFSVTVFATHHTGGQLGSNGTVVPLATESLGSAPTDTADTADTTDTTDASDKSDTSDTSDTTDTTDTTDASDKSDTSDTAGKADASTAITISQQDAQKTITEVVIGYATNVEFWGLNKVRSYVADVPEAKVTFKSYDSPCNLLHDLQAGNLDLAYLDVPSLKEVQKYQLPYTAVATASAYGSKGKSSTTYTALLISKKSSSINNISGMKSKTLGVDDFSLSGNVVPLVSLQVAGLLPDKGYTIKKFNTIKKSVSALKDGSVDAIGYASYLPLNSKEYNQLASVPEVPNPALVVADNKKDVSAVKAVIALLKSIPVNVSTSSVGDISSFSDVESVRYKFWLSQMVHSGLFNGDICSLGDEKVEDSTSNATKSSDDNSSVSSDSATDGSSDNSSSVSSDNATDSSSDNSSSVNSDDSSANGSSISSDGATDGSSDNSSSVNSDDSSANGSSVSSDSATDSSSVSSDSSSVSSDSATDSSSVSSDSATDSSSN